MLFLYTALTPAILLAAYIYWVDKNRREPLSQIAKAFAFGILSLFLSFTISFPAEWIGLYSNEIETIGDSVAISFFGAAIPEEVAKLFVLWLLLRKNIFFDEKADGIVYAVTVSLGFAAVENILYLLNHYDTWLSTGITRAIFSIPGHYAFGVLMGYYYSLAKFEKRRKRTHMLLTLLAPVVAHGIFDSILFCLETVESALLVLFLILLFISFCIIMHIYCHKKIKQHIEADYIQMLSDNSSVND